MLMNAFDKPVQSNTEQAGRGHGFARMFDRVCAFLDERVGGASALIAACQSVADRFWHSKLYFPVCFLMLAVFMAAGLPVVGGVLVMSTLIFLLLFFLAGIIFPLTTPEMIGDFKACGGVLLIATGFRMAKLKDYPIADMIPAMIMVMPMSWLWVNYILPLVS